MTSTSAARPMNLATVFALIFLPLFALAQAEHSPPRLLGIAHVGAFVSNLDEARAFYVGALGFDEPFSVKRDDGTDGIAFMRVNDDQYLELFAHDPKEGSRLSHFALRTTDIRLARSSLVFKGAKLAKDIRTGKTGDKFFTVMDPEDHFIEIVEYATNSWRERVKGRSLPPAEVSRHINYVGIQVRSMDAARRFYRDILGFREVTADSGFPDQRDWVSLQIPGCDEYIKLMPIGDGYKSEDRFGLEVGDVKTTVATLQALGGAWSHIREIDVEVGADDTWKASLSNPGGLLIELLGPPTAHGTLQNMNVIPGRTSR